MAERAIDIFRGSVRVTVVRPSIIVSSYKEPLIGWTDTMAAGRTLILSIINGYLTIVKFRRDSFLDIIPIDFVVNTIFAATAFTSLEPNPSLNIVHATSSHLNPITLGQIIDCCNKFARKYPSINQFRSPGIKSVPNS
jgi:fatty acyl-CoA reductase